MLSKMTCGLLTPSMFTISSEFDFSIAANIIRNRRIVLTPDMIESLACLKD